MKRVFKNWFDLISRRKGLFQRSMGALTACVCLSSPLLAQSDIPGGADEGVVSMSRPAQAAEYTAGYGEASGSVAARPDYGVQPVQDLWTPEDLIDDAPPFIEETFSRDPNVGFASMDNLDRIIYRAGVHTHDRYGIDNGFTTIDAFIPISISGDKSLVWFNPRVNITDDADGTLNLGVGRRFYVPDEDRVYGASFWWDHDAGHVGTYNALGGSFESLGRFFSMRGNFAIPMGDKYTQVSQATTLTPRRLGNRLVVDQLATVERAYKNFDFEITTPFPLLGDYGVDLGLGVYYVGAQQTEDAAGFSMRAQSQITEDVFISGLLTDDKIWDTNFSINVEVTLPQGSPERWFRRKPVSDMLTASVRRKYRIPTARSLNRTTRSLNSTKDGAALTVAYITPDATTATDGSYISLADYEALDLADRQAVDIIFVNRREDGTDTNLDTGIVLFDNQQLLGDGTLPDGSTQMFTSDLGTFAFPGVTAGSLPVISNSGAPGVNVVTLANSNEVTGFTIDAGGTADGIFGDTIDGANITNNTFRNVVNGINIISNTNPNLAGCFEDSVTIRNNTINGTTGLMGDGISFTHNGGNVNLRVTDNVVTGFGDTGSVGIDIAANAGTINSNDVGNSIALLNNTTTLNGTGMRVQSNTGSVINADIQNTTATFNTDVNGSGIEVIADGGFVNLETFNSNTATDNNGNGARIAALSGGNISIDDGTDTDSALTGNNFANNGFDGLRIEGDGGDVRIDQITGNTFGGGNGDDGLDVSVTAGGSVLWTSPIHDNTFNGNTGNGLEMSTNGGGLISGFIGDELISPSNQFNNNTENGAAFILNGGNILLSGFTNNQATGNTLNGMSIVNNAGGVFSTPSLLTNDFSNNTEAGLFIGGTGAGPGMLRATTSLGAVTGNNFDRTGSGTEGILFDSIDVLTTATLTQNSFVGGSGRGVGGRVSGTTGVTPQGGVDLVFGSASVLDTNTFTNNVDAHIGLIFEGNTVNSVTIDQHTLSGVTDNAATVDFNGEGVSYIVRDTAQLTGFVQRSTLNDNAGDGVSLQVTGNGAGVFGAINDFTIGGPVGFGNTITGNTQNGIQAGRTADGEINNMTIQNNTVANNGFLPVGISDHTMGSGIYLLSANAPKIDTFQILDNEITGNQNDGILLDVRADGQMSVPILRNNISQNLGNGIHTDEQVVDPTDLRGVTGPWQQNTITENVSQGIELDSASGNTDPLTLLTTPLLIGDLTNPTLGNLIADNGLDGIQVDGAGDLVIARNVITRNGVLGGFTPQDDMGIAAIDFNANPTFSATVSFNDITDNRGDGIEIDADNGFHDYIITDNVIDFNDGRGLDLLSSVFTNGFGSSSFTDVTFNNNVVNANRMEGVYIVQTADATQTQNGLQPADAGANAGFNSGGNIFSAPQLTFNSDNNQILSNGIDAEQFGGPPAGNTGPRAGGISATGFVVYIGTSDGGYGTTNPGGFASDGFIGGTQMSITNTTLSGNFGSDLYFRSFTSTVDPNTTGGSWDAMGFAPMGYQGDPLARLDLVYTNNMFDATDVNDIGAFYNNAEGTFKSRTINNMAPADGGPFGAADRLRNAQRQASRLPLFGTPTNPTNPVFGGATFLYPGTGDSTFRVQGDTLELFNAGFILDDNSPMTDIFDANGVIRNGPGNGFIDDPRYGWGTF